MSKMSKFVGRQTELQKLSNLYGLKKPSLVVLKGRRRIGKSRLVSEFASKNKNVRFFEFSALAPVEGMTAQSQRDHFGKKLGVTFDDWTDGFLFLSKHLKPGDIVLFDEISWMGLEDPTFIPKLKAWWDTVLSKSSPVLLVFCGSVSTWIEENILNSTAFFGRVSLTLNLEPLSIGEASEFLKKIGFKGSSFEQYKLLSILGGVPWYLEQIDPKHMADDNIKQLCFQRDGILVLEFQRIFHDLFNGKGRTYKKILESLQEGPKTLMEVRTKIGFGMSGTLSKMMEHLITCGFIQKHPQWSIKTEKLQKQSLYRLSDPYVRFYLKNIEPNKAKIEQGFYESYDISKIPGFDAIIGLQVENLLLQNRALLLKTMGISASDCVMDGPYRQTKTIRTKGCQIDYLVQTRTKNLFVSEFKFKRRELGIDIIEEVQERIARLTTPKSFGLVPVLFHLGGVSETVYHREYFYKVIDISDFLSMHMD